MLATQILFVSSSPPLPTSASASEPPESPLGVISEGQEASGEGAARERDSEMTATERATGEEESLEWNDWIKNYAAGKWSGNQPLSRPVIPRPLLPEPTSSSSIRQAPSPLDSPSLIASTAKSSFTSRDTASNRSNSTSGSHLEIYASSVVGENKVPRVSLQDRTPEKLLDFYQQNGYLAAPPGEQETQRLLMLKKFGLLEPCRRENIDRLCRMVKVHFQTSRVAITLVLSEHTILAAETGWGDADEPGPGGMPREVGMNDSLCAHSITRKEKGCFVVNNASEDWRFKENPSVVNQGPLQFYASANINLPSTTADSPALPVGSICLIDSKPREADSFTAEDSSLLKDMADLIARELLLGYETTRREHESKQAKYLGEFLVSANSTTNFPSTERSHASPATTASLHTPSPSENGNGSRLFQAAAEQLRALTSARSAVILDLRSFHHLASNQQIGASNTQISFTDGMSGSFASRAAAASQICLLGAAGDTIDWDDMVLREEGQAALSRAVRESLDLFKSSGGTAFESGTNDNPFAAILPVDTEAYCLVPVFDYDGSAALFLVITSDEQHFRFEVADQRFCQNVAVVCLSSLMRAKAFEADRAKLAFVSAISHELRTPLHGVSSQVELIREFSSPKERARLAPLLECAEICLESLRDVLDDTLDFAKLSNGSTPENRRLGHKRVNLETLLQDVCLATWVRRRRIDLVSSDTTPTPTPQQRVDVILEVEQRSAGWEAMVDVGALKRVLLNVLGNALKFTTAGEVKVTLREVASSREERERGRRMVTFEIADTGIGMSNDFLRNGKAFLPFVQEDAFANGTGLGLSICDRIIRQNGGTIDIASTKNVGTCVLIKLPLDLLATTPVSISNSSRSSLDNSPLSTIRRPSSRPRTAGGSSVPTFHTRIISDELGALFNPSPSLLQGATPPFECKEFNFSRAIQVAESTSAKAESVEDASPMDSDGTTISSPMTPATSIGSTDDNPTSIEPVKQSIAPNIRCLLAEDNGISRKILCRLLDGKGIDYVSTADGQEAIEAFKANAGSFQIILLDVQMPIVDGLEAAFEIRAHEKKLGLKRSRIVALTGLSNPNTSADGIIDFWLVKGGKSLKTILDEIVALQLKHDTATSSSAPTSTRPRLVSSSA